jgi:hypothetical protein
MQAPIIGILLKLHSKKAPAGFPTGAFYLL